MAKILLVEDDNNLREIFEMRLRAEGYQTVDARDGEEALVVAMKEKPDLIIADIMMPKLSGFEMLETLKAAPDMKDIKVIMMTALGQAEDRTQGEKLGVVKYLVKSQVTLEDFVRVVKEVLQPETITTQPTTSEEQAEKPQPLNTLVTTQSLKPDTPQPTPSNEPALEASPAPAPDAVMPPSAPPLTNPITGSSDDPVTANININKGDQMTEDQQQDAVDSQINDFVSGTSGSSSDTGSNSNSSVAPAAGNTSPPTDSSSSPGGITPPSSETGPPVVEPTPPVSTPPTPTTYGEASMPGSNSTSSLPVVDVPASDNVSSPPSMPSSPPSSAGSGGSGDKPADPNSVAL